MVEDEVYGEDILAVVEDLVANNDLKYVHRFLSEIGLVSESEIYEQHQFRRFVFVECDNDEIYSQEERQVINSINDLWIFPDHFLRTQKSRIACRMFYINLEQVSNYLYTAVAVMKIVNKASNCFNMFLFRLPEGFSFGAKKYDNDSDDDCTMSFPPLFSTISEELFWIQPSANFIDFYLQYIAIIEKRPYEEWDDYENKLARKRGYQNSYIEAIREIGHILNEEVENEVTRYISSFNEIPDDAAQEFKESLTAFVHSLKFEKHESVNTLEMLFDAEEVERLSIEAYNKTIITNSNENTSEDKKIHDLVSECNDNPEELIKKLKKMRGL
ncbi:MAG: hypothetical protein MJZ34_12885 [Paludibacteraceae bacterium]|nr:hypothetical protein [Paludibacteraceae bacterium]